MKISIPKELHPLETRVALTPDAVTKLIKAGSVVRIQSGAGLKSAYPDADYVKAGAEIVDSAEKLWSGSEVLAKIGLPSRAEIDLLPAGSLYIGFLNPLADPSLSAALAARQVTAFSMELIPRTSRAQSMDALSSQASIAGYKAVLLGASTLGKYFPMLTTAAGTVPPAKVLVIGVGVAGLQAIATARRLGAMVEAFDIRPEVKEQVQSLGAKFVEVRVDTSSASAGGGYAKEVSEDTKRLLQEALAERVAASDVVITTAQVPGKKAPVLVSAAMVARMKPGTVIVDMAAEQGGNVEGSKPGETVDVGGVRILGPVNLPATLPQHASQLFAKNIQALLALLMKDGKPHLDFADDIVKGACVAHGGVVVNERVKALLGS